MAKTRKNKRGHPPKKQQDHGVITKEININRMVSEKVEQTVVRRTLHISKELPAVYEVLSETSNIRIDALEVCKGTLMVEGVISFMITYSCAAQQRTHKYHGTIEYHDFIDAPGIDVGMTAVVNPEVKEMKTIYKKEDHGVTVEVVIKTLARIFDVQEISFVVEVPEKSKAQHQEVVINKVLGSSIGKLKKQETIKIPNSKASAKKVIMCRCTPIIQKYYSSFGAVTVNGWLNAEIHYIDTNHTPQTLHRLISFSKLLPVPEARLEYMAQINIGSSFSNVEIVSNGRLLQLSTEIDLKALILQHQQLKIIKDILNADDYELVKKEEVISETLIDVKSVEAIIKDTSDFSHIVEVEDVRVGPAVILSTTSHRDKVLIRGCIDVVVGFDSQDQRKYIQRRVYFKSIAVMRLTEIDNMRIETSPVVEFVKAVSSGGKLTINAVVNIIVRALFLQRNTIVTALKPVKSDGGLLPEDVSFFYTVKRGELVEQLAERFGTTVESIGLLNPGVEIRENINIRIPCEIIK